MAEEAVFARRLAFRRAYSKALHSLQAGCSPSQRWASLLKYVNSLWVLHLQHLFSSAPEISLILCGIRHHLLSREYRFPIILARNRVRPWAPE